VENRFKICYLWPSGFRGLEVQGSRFKGSGTQPTAGKRPVISDEKLWRNEHRTSNVQRPTSNEVFYLLNNAIDIWLHAKFDST